LGEAVCSQPLEAKVQQSSNHLTKNGLLVELASGVLPMSGNDMPASRTVAPKRISSLLPTNLPLFSRYPQLPIPLGVDLLLTPGQHCPSA
jgi:hypothetical protein